MSNTAEVTPYEATPAREVDSGPGLIETIASFLSEESDAVALARMNYRAQCRKERQASTRINSVALNIADVNRIVLAATGLGYKAVPTATPQLHGAASPILMQNSAGQRIALRSANGHVQLHARALPELHAVVREHTVQAVRHHLAAKWTDVKTRATADGGVEIEAREAPSQARERATLKARIGTDGTSHLDIDHVKGNRCENILKDYATVTSGKATVIKKKSAFFQQPGEPAKVKL